MIMQALWLRESQIHAFETLINIFANGLSINPDISKRINTLTDDYLELRIPGSKEVRKQNDNDFIAESAKTLNEVTQLLSNYKGNRFYKK